ncbi:MAG: hypothetical protein K2Y30_02060 [Flavobacteriaceae bacterium]|nr:hypothetical protein [Flavobacteriaceae bacterium]
MEWLLAIIGIFILLALFGKNKPKKKNLPTRKEIDFNLRDYDGHYSFDVKGVHLQDYLYPVLNYCQKLDLITLISEPDNHYDKHAIKVMNSGWHIGYVPADETTEVKDILNKEYLAYIESIEKLGYVRVSVKIRFKN